MTVESDPAPNITLNQMIADMERATIEFRDSLIAGFERTAIDLRETMLSSKTVLCQQTLNTFMNIQRLQ